MSYWRNLVARWGSGDGEVDEVRIDGATNVLSTIDYAHHEVHGGSGYRVEIEKDVAGSGTYNIVFTTPNTTKWLHITYHIEVEGEADVKFYEGITSWTGGSAITPYNANRNSGNTSGVTDMKYDGTITLGSPIVLSTRVIGSAGGHPASDSGGSKTTRGEWILKQNEKYALVITDQSGSNNEVGIQLDWYEHTDKH